MLIGSAGCLSRVVCLEMPRNGLPPFAVSLAGNDQLLLSKAAVNVAYEAVFLANAGAEPEPEAGGLL